MATFDEKRVVNGTYGQLWWDGAAVAEVTSFKATVKLDREDVQMAGTIEAGSKIKMVKGEGTFKLKKVFSRGLTDMFNAYKLGKDVSSVLIVKLADPDSFGSERLVLSDVKFDELTLMDWEMNKIGETEYPFRFKVSTAAFVDLIVANEQITG